MNYFDPEARWLDGPALADWLEPHVPSTVRHGWIASLARRIKEWRAGVTADLYTVDRYLCRLGLHPAEIPDELWCEAAPKGRCRNGHVRSEENTYLRSDGRVECRVCSGKLGTKVGRPKAVAR